MSKLYEIDELKGEALQTALQSERDGDWDGKKMTPAILKDYSRMCRTKYNEKGEFVQYGEGVEMDCENCAHCIEDYPCERDIFCVIKNRRLDCRDGRCSHYEDVSEVE